KELIAKNNPDDYLPQVLEKTEMVVISGLVAFRESMELLKNEAKLGHAVKNEERSWPELAQFDCYACHHDLKSNSWRQKRGYTGKPGRPDVRPWPTALVKLAIQHAAQDNKELAANLSAEYGLRVKALSAAFDAQPFGDPKKVAAAATAAADWADQL